MNTQFQGYWKKGGQDIYFLLQNSAHPWSQHTLHITHLNMYLNSNSPMHLSLLLMALNQHKILAFMKNGTCLLMSATVSSCRNSAGTSNFTRKRAR